MVCRYDRGSFRHLAVPSVYAGARLLVRADLNVPRTDTGAIADDFRLRAIVPTLDYLYPHAAAITLLTHMGGAQPTVSQASLAASLVAWFEGRGYHAPRLRIAHDVRDDRREQDLGSAGICYARELAGSAEWYIFDAFASAHRQAASLTLLPRLFPPERRSIGLSVADELDRIALIRHRAPRPIVMVLGGGKVATKLPLIIPLLSFADRILLCPGLSDPFVMSDHPQASLAQDISASIDHTRLMLPIDTIPYGIGPRTFALWRPIIAQAGTIIYNGPMGMSAVHESIVMRDMLFTEIACANGMIFVGGGDTMRLVHELHVAQSMAGCSTGGGAFLRAVAGLSLPALDALGADSYAV